ncbi:hypothetical protein [Idiomarina sp.]|uniref:hypothetical protein n=1 Tax=Idiomarina sp. TaxID=1874361 RepID=UPI0025C20C4F|nr:hypothetical protein [Idiomarina sp.]
MKSLEEKFAWLRNASAEERELAIKVFKQQVSIHQDGIMYVDVDELSLPLDKEFARVLDRHFPSSTGTSKLAKNAIIQKVRQRVASHRRRKSKDVKSTSIELTKEGYECLQGLRKICKASQNLVVDSLLKDELDYVVKLKDEIKAIKQEQRQLRAENRELKNEVRKLETENEDYKSQLESLGKLQRDAYQERQFDIERSNDGDNSSVSDNQVYDEEFDESSTGSQIESDTMDGNDGDMLSGKSEDTNKEVEPTANLTKTQRAARFMTRSGQHQDPDIPKKSNTCMQAIYDSDEDNKTLKFD